MDTTAEKEAPIATGGATSQPRVKFSAATAAVLLARLILGGVFIYMGVNKALHPVEFLKLIKQYELLSGPPWLNLIAATLPWFEVFCGMLLVLGIAVRGVSLNLLLMLVPFTIVIARRALEMSKTSGAAFTEIKFDCGCGGGEVVIWQKLIENSALILLAVLLLTRKEKMFCARFDLFSPASRDTTSK
jgi:putative oxidoreductase